MPGLVEGHLPKSVKIRTDEYDRMAEAGVFNPERRPMELVGGDLYEMPPIGAPHLIVVTRLQRMLSRQEGVTEVCVNFATGRATVAFVRDAVEGASLVAAVEDMGV